MNTTLGLSRGERRTSHFGEIKEIGKDDSEHSSNFIDVNGNVDDGDDDMSKETESVGYLRIKQEDSSSRAKKKSKSPLIQRKKSFTKS